MDDPRRRRYKLQLELHSRLRTIRPFAGCAWELNLRLHLSWREVRACTKAVANFASSHVLSGRAPEWDSRGGVRRGRLPRRTGDHWTDDGGPLGGAVPTDHGGALRQARPVAACQRAGLRSLCVCGVFGFRGCCFSRGFALRLCRRQVEARCPKNFAEDPFLWRSKRGWHLIAHAICDWHGT